MEFARSLAGYYVSTYVLGCDSRTADNVMLSPTGELFNFELTCLNLRERMASLPLEYCTSPADNTGGLRGGYKSHELDPANNKSSASASNPPVTPPYPGFNSLAASVGNALKTTAYVQYIYSAYRYIDLSSPTLICYTPLLSMHPAPL